MVSYIIDDGGKEMEGTVVGEHFLGGLNSPMWGWRIWPDSNPKDESDGLLCVLRVR
jgi:hypothetical protein